MTTQPAYTQVHFDPIADPRAVVVAGPARFTVLTSRLIRMEYAPDGRFEDRPSQAFWFRRQPVPDYHVERVDGKLVLTTGHLRLDYRVGEPFDPNSLSVALLPDGPTWHYGDAGDDNLKGTARTLDEADGRIVLEPGLLSRDGLTVVDDGRSLVFDETGWLIGRDAAEGAQDLYCFGYGSAFQEALRDYARLAGDTPLLPRWVLGNWWSRYWDYSDADLRALMTDFRDHNVPLSVCIIDMDWHLVDVGEGVNGWTGYTWNSDLFPDPPDFIQWLHGQGLRTALNLHPALGIRPHEAMYAAMAERMGLDPAAGATIPFDIADPQFTRAYFEVLHHPQEEMGVDFWWLDWQQGTRSKVAGLDPLWWLNHLHYYDLGREGKRPFIFSRWGGLGNHRYPIGFSGDTVVSWESLAFQPYFTATAANVAYGWWSHDIGGHMGGTEHRELYTRWVQFGVFSPIFRLHCTKNAVHERRPWGYDAEVERITRDAMQLRHALIPYLYTMSWLNETEARSPVRPMYHDYPEHDEAYDCPQQYLFGADFIVAPFTEPLDEKTGLASQTVWLPPGDWYHFLSGRHYRGDARHVLRSRLEDIPVFVRAGAVIPLGPRVGWGGVENPDELHLHFYPGDDGRFVLFEDDGLSMAYREGTCALTRFGQRRRNGNIDLSISPAGGDLSVAPTRRTYHVYIHGISAVDRIAARLDGGAIPVLVDHSYEGEGVRLEPITLERSSTVEIALQVTTA